MDFKKLRDRFKYKLLYLITFLIITIGLITTYLFLISKPSPSQKIEKERFISEYISDKLLLADSNRHKNVLFYEKILTELTLLKELFTPKQNNYYLFLLGYLRTYNGQYDEANKLLSTLIHSNASKLIKFRATELLINIAAAQKNWSDGLMHIAANKKILPSIVSEEHYQMSLLTFITFYNQLQQFELVLENIALVKRNNLTTEQNCLLDKLYVEAKFNLQTIQVNDNAFEQGLTTCLQADNKVNTNNIRVYRAKLYLTVKQPHKALAEVLPYYNEINTTQTPLLITNMNNMLASSFYQLKKLVHAQDYALASLANNSNNKFLKQSIESYKILYKMHKAQGNNIQALGYHEKYNTLEDKYIEAKKAKYIAFQFTELKTFEHENQITLLNKQNQFLATEQLLSHMKIANIHLMIGIMLIIIMILIIIGILLLKSHKRVKTLSEYDKLTGIYNRRHFSVLARRALKHGERTKHDLSLIMFDLDYFKKINDSFGHTCGDWALKETIRVCKSIGRKSDMFARLGGEEFCILLPSCNANTAALRAESYRKAIEDTITEESGNYFTITASFGVTDVIRSGYNLEKLLIDADTATYQSKHTGRNKVTIFTLKEQNTQELLDSSWSIIN